MYMYHKRENHWDAKLLITGLVLGGLIIVLSSWVEAAAEHATDYHLDTQTDDQRADQQCQQESKDDGAAAYTDSSGTTHIYQDGKEID